MGKTVIKPNRPIKTFSQALAVGNTTYTTIDYSSAGFTEVPLVSAGMAQNGFNSWTIVSVGNVTKTSCQVWYCNANGAAANLRVIAIGY